MSKRRTEQSDTPEPPAHEARPEPAKSEPVAVADGNLIHDVLKLKHDYESKREAAIAELLKRRTDIENEFNEKRTEIENQLTELGYVREPEWVPVPASKVKPFRKTKAKAKSAPERFCPICTTDPENPVVGHDGRAHKSQGKRKRAFTEAELAAR